MYKEYQLRPKTVKAEQFNKGMENGWRIYYDGCTYDMDGEHKYSSWEDLKTLKSANKFIKNHKEFKCEKPIPLMILENDEDEFEMTFGDYIFENGYIMEEKDFNEQYEELV